MASLITTIDPLDKINSANDSGVISSVSQFGRAMDSYGANHNNFYINAADTNAALTTLNTQGETKITSYTPPTGYTVAYIFTPAACTSGTTCIGYAFYTTALKAKKNINGTPPSNGPFYQYANGRGCYIASVITQAQLNALGASSTGAGACP